MSQPTTDGKIVEEAKRLVEQAHSSYRESRDRLALLILSGDVKDAGAREC